MGKKTVKVGSLLEKANFILNNPNVSQDEKSGVSLLLESLINETDNYNGFVYSGKTEAHEEYTRSYVPHENIANDFYMFKNERNEKGYR
jgi:hypothetical protein